MNSHRFKPNKPPLPPNDSKCFSRKVPSLKVNGKKWTWEHNWQTGQATRAKAGLDIATSRVQGTKLKAPFNGVIVERTIEVGEMMGGPATRPPLQIVDLSTVRIQASIGETDAVSLSDNQNGTLEIPGQHEGIPVSLSRINQAVDPIVKTVLVEATLNNSKHTLKHHQSATLHWNSINVPSPFRAACSIVKASP